MAYRDYESITVATTAIGFTAGNYLDSGTTSVSPTKTARKAFLTLEGGQIRFRADGTDPTSTEGHIMNSGETLVIDGYDDIRRFRAIRTGAVSGTLKVSYA